MRHRFVCSENQWSTRRFPVSVYCSSRFKFEAYKTVKCYSSRSRRINRLQVLDEDVWFSSKSSSEGQRGGIKSLDTEDGTATYSKRSRKKSLLADQVSTSPDSLRPGQESGIFQNQARGPAQSTKVANKFISFESDHDTRQRRVRDAGYMPRKKKLHTKPRKQRAYQQKELPSTMRRQHLRSVHVTPRELEPASTSKSGAAQQPWDYREKEVRHGRPHRQMNTDQSYPGIRKRRRKPSGARNEAGTVRLSSGKGLSSTQRGWKLALASYSVAELQQRQEEFYQNMVVSLDIEFSPRSFSNAESTLKGGEDVWSPPSDSGRNSINYTIGDSPWSQPDDLEHDIDIADISRFLPHASDKGGGNTSDWWMSDSTDGLGDSDSDLEALLDMIASTDYDSGLESNSSGKFDKTQDTVTTFQVAETSETLLPGVVVDCEPRALFGRMQTDIPVQIDQASKWGVLWSRATQHPTRASETSHFPPPLLPQAGSKSPSPQVDSENSDKVMLNRLLLLEDDM